MTDSVLIEQTRSLVASERKIVKQILLNLKEIERRRLFLKRGYSSLFVFCTRELGYSEAAASRRVEAMRALKELPCLGDKLEKGEITLSNVALAQKVIRHEVKRSGQKLSIQEKSEVFAKVEKKSYKEATKLLVEKFPLALPKESTQELTKNETKIQFVADSELMAKLEELKHQFSHKNNNPSYNELLHLMADAILKPSKRGSIVKKSSGRGSLKQQTPNRSRYVSKSVKKAVFERDHGECQYIDSKTGRKCGSRHLIQYDHIVPWVKGGRNTVGNLQLLCAGHNQLKGGG